jgi:phosphonate transport system substrate-binding protein
MRASVHKWLPKTARIVPVRAGDVPEMRSAGRSICAVLFALFWSISSADEPTTSADFKGPRTLVLGRISDDPKTHYKGLRPLLDYVVERMADLGVTEGKVIMARDRRQMLSYLRQGKVDWVSDTVGTALILRHRGNGRFLATHRKLGESDYRATVFVRRDSSIESMEDLRGNTIAFEHIGSTTGFMVPAVELLRHNLPLALMGSPRERPPEHMVGYFFSGDEINTSTWVDKRLIDAGAMANTDWDRPHQVPTAFKGDLRIIYEGEKLPRALEVVRNGLDPVIAARLKKILLETHQNEIGMEILKGYQNTSRFDDYVPQQWPYVESLWDDLEKVLAEVD